MRGSNSNEIKFKFINEPTRNFYFCETRNQCLSGGFGSGKTYVAIYKLLTLLLHFRGSRAAICRLEYKTLLDTTYKTFTKLCPESLISHWDKQRGYMRLVNGSEILWMHLDDQDENTLKGLEINWAYVDQPEELSEGVYTLLDARVGRWDMGVPDPSLCDPNDFECDPETGRYKLPAYLFLTPNPDSETHWIWRDYHPDSPLKHTSETHSYYEVASTENPYLDPEILATSMTRDEAWVKRYVFGQWGISAASIHKLLPVSLLDYNKGFLDKILREANLYRILDHGDAAATCVTWWAAWKDWHICYREYYAPGKLITEHRRVIAKLSGDETYAADYADPAIFKMQSQKNGGFWCVANEYTESYTWQDGPEGEDVEIPAIGWSPADNNEMATRNIINELLALNLSTKHIITGKTPAPAVYIIKASPEYPYGCVELQKQMGAARRKKLGEVNGRPIYSDDREPSIEDHSYDTARYYFAMHANAPKETRRSPSETSFEGARRRMKLAKILEREGGRIDKHGMKRSRA